MNYLKELGIILTVCVLGEVLSVLIGGALPSNILGMVLMLILLKSRLLKINQIEHTADFFLKNMAVFFIPVSLGILEIYDKLKGQLAAIIAVCFITTFLTALATAYTVHFVLILQKRRDKNV